MMLKPWNTEYIEERRPARTGSRLPRPGAGTGAGPEAVDQAAGAAGESSPRKRTT